MEPLCNAFASIAATMARKEYRTAFDVTVFGYEVTRHGEYLRRLRPPSAIYILAYPEVSGFGLMKAHPRLLGKILDISLGGNGELADGDAGRALTPVDLSIYSRFVDVLCRAFHDGIVEICGRSQIGHPHKTRFEEQPGMIRIAPDRAHIFVIKLNFFIGEDSNGAGMDFVVPVSTLEPLKRDLSNIVTANEATKRMWEQYMFEQVMDLPMKAQAIIDLGMFNIGELSRLEQGQLLDLPPDAIEGVNIVVETAEGTVNLAKGRLGAKGRHKALRLNEEPSGEFLQPLKTLVDQRSD
ncbi:MAG: hypothetical protein AAF666_12190 [Pseudomonadota bacterium]